MNALKNIAISISARIDQLASQFENHPALAASMIAELETALAEVKVQHGSIQRERERLNNRITAYSQEKDRWTERVKRAFTTDEQKALECVQRIKQIDNALSESRSEEATVASLELRVTEHLHTIESKLDELRRKKVDLTTRQYCADALSKASTLSLGAEQNFENIFNRWETEITRKEIHGKTTEPVHDPLDKQFSETENREELLMMLQKIVGTETTN